MSRRKHDGEETEPVEATGPDAVLKAIQLAKEGDKSGAAKLVAGTINEMVQGGVEIKENSFSKCNYDAMSDSDVADKLEKHLDEAGYTPTQFASTEGGEALEAKPKGPIADTFLALLLAFLKKLLGT